MYTARQAQSIAANRYAAQREQQHFVKLESLLNLAKLSQLHLL
jgi:hypothetical protein